MDVSVIIPVMNEAENLPFVLPLIPQSKEISEVILVDGGSTDGTIDIAQSILPAARLVRQGGKGKSDAVRCGAEIACGDYVLVLDGDGSHDPADILRFIEVAREGYDLVKGSRLLPGGRSYDETPVRRFLVKLTDAVANLLWGTHFSDIVFGMFLVHRQQFLDLRLTSNGFAVESQCMVRAVRRGYKIVQIPIVERRRLRGRSHLSIFRDGWYIGSTILAEFFHLLKDNHRERATEAKEVLAEPGEPLTRTGL